MLLKYRIDVKFWYELLTVKYYNKLKKFKELILDEFNYDIVVSDNIYTKRDIKRYILVEERIFPLWIDIVNNLAYIFTKELKTQISLDKMSINWVNRTNEFVKKCIDQRLAISKIDRVNIDEFIIESIRGENR